VDLLLLAIFWARVIFFVTVFRIICGKGPSIKDVSSEREGGEDYPQKRFEAMGRDSVLIIKCLKMTIYH